MLEAPKSKALKDLDVCPYFKAVMCELLYNSSVLVYRFPHERFQAGDLIKVLMEVVPKMGKKELFALKRLLDEFWYLYYHLHL